MKFDRLFSPIEIKPGFTLKNRIVMPAMHHLYTDNGYCTERFREYYYRRAAGGAAMVIVGSCRFDDYGAKANSMSLRTDDTIPGWQEFTAGMHQRGCKVAVQLYHAGRYMPKRDVPCGEDALSPSATFASYTRETAPEMTQQQMQRLLRDYADGARRAVQAGFDAVEISASSGYLLCQFLSPLTNLRTDEYGGSFENRCRFPLQVIRTVREAVGESYPILLRLGAKDFVPNSSDLEEHAAFAALAEEAGVDMFNVTGGWHETRVPQLPGEVPRGGLSYLGTAICAKVSVPVMICNRINDPVEAEKILALGRADIVGMGRPLLADPDLPVKAQSGRPEEIRRCVACNQGCLANTFFDRPIKCLVNGLCGREYLYPDTPAAAPKKLLVIGGGPAGCEFSVRAAARGHHVTLCEKSGRLGGQLNITAVVPAKYEFGALIKYYETMLAKLHVDVRLNTEVTPETAKAGCYDEIIVAAGGTPNTTALPVAGGCTMPIFTSTQVLRQEVMPGRRVAVIGGSFVGCSAAHYLAREGSISAEQLYYLAAYKGEEPDTLMQMLGRSDREVTLIEQGPKIGFGYESGVGWPTLMDLGRLGVAQWKNSRVLSVHDSGLTVERTAKDGTVSQVELACDTVVVASGVHPDGVLAAALRAAGLSVTAIGNADHLGRAIDAIEAAAELGASI